MPPDLTILRVIAELLSNNGYTADVWADGLQVEASDGRRWWLEAEQER